MTQIEELLRTTATTVERNDDAARRAIQRAQRALSAAIAAEVSQPQSRSRARARPWRLKLPHRRIGFGAGLVGAGTIAAVIALLVPGGGNVIQPSPAAAAILGHAAEVVPTGMPADPGPEQYLYTEVKWVDQSSNGQVTQTDDTWDNPQDGGVQTRTGQDVGPGLSWQRINPRSLSEYTYAQLQQLPTSVPALGAWLKQQAGTRSGVNPQEWTNHESWTLIHDILIAQLVPSKLRAALYQVAATIPGVTSLGTTKDAAGRNALAITFNDPLYTEHDELLFDPSTYLLTGESEVNANTGQIMESEALIQSRIVDSIPQAVLAAAPNPSQVASLPG